MIISMYQASIPMLIRMMNNLSGILNKADMHAEVKKIDQSIFINARLTPDMLPLSKQIQIVSDTAKGCGARLANIEVPSFEDMETTFPELQERLTKTIKFLESISENQINNSEEREITLKLPNKVLNFTGYTYLFDFVIPNFFFHLNMAYAILRHHGIEIGKLDYLGNKPD